MMDITKRERENMGYNQRLQWASYSHLRWSEKERLKIRGEDLGVSTLAEGSAYKMLRGDTVRRN